MGNGNETSGYEKAAHLYDLFDRKPNREFFQDVAYPVDELIDIGAGTGRIAVPLARSGKTVFCVEPSPAMRREFLKKLEADPDISSRITLIPGDAASFGTDRIFPLAIMSGGFDHFLDDDGRRAALRNIHDHLEPGGVLVFDVFLGLMKDSDLSPAGNVKIGDMEYRRFVGGRVLPGGTKETVLVYETYRRGEMIERIEERSRVGITTRGEIHALLQSAGFAVEAEYSDYQYTPYESGESVLIIRALRRAEKRVSRAFGH